MKLDLHILIIALVVSLNACTSSIPLSPINATEQEAKLIKSYEVGKRTSAYIGDTMIRVQRRIVNHNVVKPTENFLLRQVFGGVGGLSTNTYPIAGTTTYNGINYFVVPLPAYGGLAKNFSHGALVDENGNIQSRIFTYNNIAGLRYGNEDYELIPPTARMELLSKNIDMNIGSGDDNYELVFSGITGSHIRMLYREYTLGNRARPAFSQNLTYEKSTKTIRFRKILMNLHEVNEQRIVFTVVQD